MMPHRCTLDLATATREQLVDEVKALRARIDQMENDAFERYD